MAIKFPTLVKERDLKQFQLKQGLQDLQQFNKDQTQLAMKQGLNNLQKEIDRPVNIDDDFRWEPKTGDVSTTFDGQVVGKTSNPEAVDTIVSRWYGGEYEPTMRSDHERNSGLDAPVSSPPETELAGGGGNPSPRDVSEANAIIPEQSLSVVYPVAGHPIKINNPFGGEQYRGSTIDPSEPFPTKNSGVDLFAPEGTSLLSPRDGTVVKAGSSDTTGVHHGYGNTVLIKADDGSLHRLSHLSEVQVKKGNKLSAGDVIGLSGDTGNTTGPHLDYEFYTPDGKLVDATFQFNKAITGETPSGATGGGGVGGWFSWVPDVVRNIF